RRTRGRRRGDRGERSAGARQASLGRRRRHVVGVLDRKGRGQRRVTGMGPTPTPATQLLVGSLLGYRIVPADLTGYPSVGTSLARVSPPALHSLESAHPAYDRPLSLGAHRRRRLEEGLALDAHPELVRVLQRHHTVAMAV